MSLRQVLRWNPHGAKVDGKLDFSVAEDGSRRVKFDAATRWRPVPTRLVSGRDVFRAGTQTELERGEVLPQERDVWLRIAVV